MWLCLQAKLLSYGNKKNIRSTGLGLLVAFTIPQLCKAV
jgi:hypothetical protein